MNDLPFEYEALSEHRRCMEDTAQQALAKLLRQRMVLSRRLREIATSMPTTSDGAPAGPVHETLGDPPEPHTAQVRARLRMLAAQIESAEARLAQAKRSTQAMERLSQKLYRRATRGARDVSGRLLVPQGVC